MYNGSLAGLRIDKRDEVYPTGISCGFPGYTYEKALDCKEGQIAIMQSSSKTVEVIVDIEPIPGRVDEYLVRNNSTYVCSF